MSKHSFCNDLSNTSIHNEDGNDSIHKHLANSTERIKIVAGKEMLNDYDSSSEVSLATEDVSNNECVPYEHCDNDPELNLILNDLEKSVSRLGIKSQNKTFSATQVRDIERTNDILMKKIASHKKRANMYAVAPKNKNLSSSAINRKREQAQIDRDNVILLRRIRSVKPFVVNNLKH